MVGKREKKRKRMRLPAVLMLVFAIGFLLIQDGPRGVAADSPVEMPVAKEAPVEPVVSPPEVEPVPVRVPEAEPAAPEEEEPWPGPVMESAAVEDTYFDDVVFLGDSRTDGLRIYGGMEHGEFLCATGATVESVFTKPVETAKGTMPLLDALAKMDCGKIYIMLGVNELGWKGTETYREQTGKLIDRLKEDHPEAEIVLQSILPVGAKQEAKKTYVNNLRIEEYNGVLMELAEEKRCAYLEVSEAVVDESGCLRSDWSYDDVHLNKKGCAAWLEYLRTHAVTKSEV